MVRFGTIYQGDIANSLNEIPGSPLAEIVDQDIAAFPARCQNPNFDQFMMRNCQIKLLHHRVRQSGIAHGERWFELMAESTQKFLL